MNRSTTAPGTPSCRGFTLRSRVAVSRTGTLLLLLGLLTGPSAAQLPFHLRLSGSQASEGLGTGLAVGADFDGDGRPDLLVGAPGWLDPSGQDFGRLEIRSSRDGSLIQTKIGRNPGDRFGHRVLSGFDFDQDGVADFAVAAPGWDQDYANIDAGRVYLFSGAGLTLVTRLDGKNLRAYFGSALGNAGDVNGDGWPDLLVGAPGTSLTAFTQGLASVIDGRFGTVIRDHLGDAANDSLGTAVAGIGDLDGDGFDDYAIGIPGIDQVIVDGGEVRIMSGASGAVLRRHFGITAHSGYGTAIVRLGDINADGVEDYAISAPTDPRPGVNGGRVEIYDGLTGDILAARDADSSLDRFGISLATGDFDGDGRPDLLIGATGDRQGGLGAGSVSLVDLGGGLIDRFDGLPGSYLGQQVASAGDLEGDGIDDFLFSARGNGANGQEGAMALLSRVGARTDAPTGAVFGLGLRFRPGPGQPRRGSLEVTGPAGAVGRLYLSAGIQDAQVGPIRVLIDHGSILAFDHLQLGPAGISTRPLDLAGPGLDGLVFHLQAYAGSASGLLASPRLSLIFGR